MTTVVSTNSTPSLISGIFPSVVTTFFPVYTGSTIPANTPLVYVNETVYSVSSATLKSGGSGYVVGDSFFAGNIGYLTVTGVNDGAVTTFTIEDLATGLTTDPANSSLVVTGGSGTGLTLTITSTNQTLKSLQIAKQGSPSVGISVSDITINMNFASVYVCGCFNPDALNWDASYTTDEQKNEAFIGATNPTNIVLQRVTVANSYSVIE